MEIIFTQLHVLHYTPIMVKFYNLEMQLGQVDWDYTSP